MGGMDDTDYDAFARARAWASRAGVACGRRTPTPRDASAV